MKKGMVSISRYASTNEIRIEITDGSMDRIVNVVMSPHDFGLALTGLQYRECKYEEGKK
jgi:hypothetical protein